MTALAAFYWRYSRPIQCYWQHLLEEVVGLYMMIGSTFQDLQRAHMRPSAASLRRSYGPIHDHWENFHDLQWAHMRPSAACHQKYNRPIQCFQQHLLGEVMGLYMALGSIFQDSQWAHMRPSAAFHWRYSRAIQCYRQHLLGEAMGLFMTIGSTFRQH